jgi:membrane protein
VKLQLLNGRVDTTREERLTELVIVTFKSITKNRAVQWFLITFRKWNEAKALRLAAALSYYSVFSIAPLLVIAVGVAGLVLGAEAVQGQLEGQLRSVLGERAAEAVQSLVQSSSKPSQGWLAAVTGTGALVFGASAFFVQLKDALNTIWEVPTKSGEGVMGLIKDRLVNFGMVLVIGFFLLVSLVLSTVIAALNKYLGDILGIPGEVWAVAAFLVSMAMVTGLFALIFKILPDAKIRWRDVWIGALLTAVLFEIGKFGLSLYLGRESTASSYGAAASVVLLLLWLYYASCILLFGAEFTRVYSQSGIRTGEAVNAAVAVNPAAMSAEGSVIGQPLPGPLVTAALVPTLPAEPLPSDQPAFSPGFKAAVAACFLIGVALELRQQKSASEPLHHP